MKSSRTPGRRCRPMLEIETAPASMHARTTSDSCSSPSERPGRIGATSTPHAMPASVRRASASTRLPGRRRAGLADPPDLLVERADREVHAHARCARAAAASTSRSRCIIVDFVRIENGLRARAERLDDAAREPVAALALLVGIGVRAHRDVVAAPARPRELGGEPLDGVDLDDDAPLEVLAAVRARGTRASAARSSTCRRGCSRGTG